MAIPGLNFKLTQEIVDQLPEGEMRDQFQQLVTQREAAYVESDQFAADRCFRQALRVYDSQEVAERLVTWNELYAFTDDEVRDLLADYWDIAEAWSGDERLRTGMLGLLRRVAPLHVVEDDGEPLPSGRLTIYRGNLGERPGTGSWSLDPEVAERFAVMGMSIRGQLLGMYREDGVPTVWRATVDASDVLGYFTARGEREVVVEAESLDDVTAIRQAVAGALG